MDSEDHYLLSAHLGPGILGRIDHLSIDVKRSAPVRAALGNNSLEVIYLKENERVTAAGSGLLRPDGRKSTDANDFTKQSVETTASSA